MKAASSVALDRPPSGARKFGSPRGGSPRRARTFSMPAAAKRSRISINPSRVSPTQLRCAIASSPCACLMRVAISTVPSRVAPPAPYVTETKEGSSGFRASTVSNSSSTFSGVFGGKNSIEKTGSGPPRISSMRMGRGGREGRSPHAQRTRQAKPWRLGRVSTHMNQRPEEAVNAEREPSFLLANPEKRLLRWIAARLPRWILPDDLTALGVLAAFATCGAYQLSNDSSAWLWVASGLLVVHWLGDSLDGTLARVRGIERPK